MKIRTAYGEYNPVDYALDDFGESLTEQCHKAACDIDSIIDRYDRTGVLSHVNAVEPRYVDISQLDSYEDAFVIVKQAEETFMLLPSELRKRFDNDPVKYLDFVSDEANIDEMRKLGLAVPEVEPESPVEVVVVGSSGDDLES